MLVRVGVGTEFFSVTASRSIPDSSRVLDACHCWYSRTPGATARRGARTGTAPAEVSLGDPGPGRS